MYSRSAPLTVSVVEVGITAWALARSIDSPMSLSPLLVVRLLLAQPYVGGAECEYLGAVYRSGSVELGGARSATAPTGRHPRSTSGSTPTAPGSPPACPAGPGRSSTAPRCAPSRRWSASSG